MACWILTHHKGPGLALGAILAFVPAGAVDAHGDVETRMDRATRQIAVEPERVEPLLRRAELHRRSGEFEAARQDLERVSRIAPGLPELMHARARVHLDERAPGEALVVLDGLLAAEPDDVTGHLLRARSLRVLDRPCDAAAAYTGAIERSRVPTPDVYLERARTLDSCGASHLPAAISGIDEGIEALGPLPALTRAAVDLELRAGRPGAALSRVEDEIGRARQPLWWWVRKGELLEAAERHAEALDAFAEAQRLLHAQPAHRRGRPAWRALEERLTAVLDPS